MMPDAPTLIETLQAERLDWAALRAFVQKQSDDLPGGSVSSYRDGKEFAYDVVLAEIDNLESARTDPEGGNQ